MKDDQKHKDEEKYKALLNGFERLSLGMKQRGIFNKYLGYSAEYG